MEHGLKNIAFYVQKHIIPRAACHDFPVFIDKLLGAPGFMKLIDVVSATEFHIGCHTGLTYRRCRYQNVVKLRFYLGFADLDV